MGRDSHAKLNRARVVRIKRMVTDKWEQKDLPGDFSRIARDLTWEDVKPSHSHVFADAVALERAS